MKTVILKSILLENYKSFSSSLPGRKDFSCEFGKRTKISGRNREGKSTVKDAFFDVLTSKLADGSQPDAKVRPHTKDGIDIDRVDIIRDLELEIDGKQVPFKASAAIPRIYRIKFHRDIYKDLDALGKAVGNGDAENSRLDMFSLEMFENIAYVMAKHADPSIPDSPEEWLDEFSTFSIYQVLPKIIKLWGLNVQTDVSSKKNFAQLTAK